MARIDDSHQPYKRKRKLGPGPKRSTPKLQAKDWECRRGSKPYVQICTWIGDGNRKPTTSKMNRAKKKKYNKLYRAWMRNKRTGGSKQAGYKCHRTKFATCK